jgi:DNA-binding response OmpR family regulator
MDTAADHDVGAHATRPVQQAADLTAETLASQTAGHAASVADSDHDPLRDHALARAAHELKTPLAVIKGSATTLLSNAGRWDPATQQELLQLIDAQVDRLHTLVNGLLAVWRLNGELLPPHLAPTCVDTLLGDLATRWRERASDHPLHVVAAPELPEVAVDPERLGLALERLVACAAAGAPERTPVRIEARAAAAEVVFRVMRAGQTPTAGERAQMFEPFSSAPGQGQGQGPEAALELAEARAIVHAHGGHLAALAPAHGAGLVLALSLPVAPAAESRPADHAAALTSPIRHAPRTRERPVVLVAEGDQHLARYLRAHLEAQGYRALLAPNPSQLARLIDLEEPDLLLLDAQLGHSAGAAARDHLREHHAIPTIVLGHGEEAECARALDLGAADYLAKPFGLQELLARIRAALRRASALGGETEPAEALFRSGDLMIDFSQRQVTAGDRAVQLSRTEYKLLCALARHAGRVLSHEQLLQRVWGPGYGREVEFLWVYVRRLRRKIEPDPRCPRYILTIPGVGYRLAQL